ncbi:response regulator [Lysobacter sp. A3-1-A15]|uniref:response regulator n=1 Tax=Novilysobacter viscosus TaxID=3098602 RepID=UPI002ED941BD
MAAPLTQAGAGPATGLAQAIAGEPVKILLVDDQPGRLLTYRAILEPLGETLVEASSGMEALKRLMDEDFAVILLDVNMPGMDGFETASLIHQHPRFEKTPIIFVTAVNVSDMDRLHGYKLGAVDYVMVPVIPEILRSKVEVLAELHRKRRELQVLNESLAADNQALQLEKARELEALNESLREANSALATRNEELQREVAERVRAEQLLRDADQRKDEFLATLAHELRNPLAPLQNALSVRRLSMGDAEDPLQDTMERQVALLIRLIDDLLDIARITQGKLTLRESDTTLEDVLAAAVEIARPLIEAGEHAFEMHLPEESIVLRADHARLSQVFANLLNNAAKYSDPGSRIELHAALQDDEIRVSVSDTGVGLAPEQLDAVFEVFRQVDTTVERSRGGLGVGLTLVQKLAQMHAGRVEVHSEGLGRGSTFHVHLPRMPGTTDTPVQGTAGPADSRATPSGESAPRRVLIVDDNRDAADTLAMMVRLLGHDVVQIYDPHAVETEVDRFAPDLLFLDVGMPGRSGYDIASTLRGRPGGTNLEIVAVTGWGQPEDRRRTQEAGFDDHLVKPPHFDAIKRICEGAARPAGKASDA